LNFILKETSPRHQQILVLSILNFLQDVLKEDYQVMDLLHLHGRSTFLSGKYVLIHFHSHLKGLNDLIKEHHHSKMLQIFALGHHPLDFSFILQVPQLHLLFQIENFPLNQFLANLLLPGNLNDYHLLN
jgi:hypothetical protein